MRIFTRCVPAIVYRCEICYVSNYSYSASTHKRLSWCNRWPRPSDGLSLSSKKFRLNLCRTFVSHVNVSYISIRVMRQYPMRDVVVQRDGTNLRAWYLSSRVLYMDGHSEAGSALHFSIYRSLPYLFFYIWISYFRSAVKISNVRRKTNI
jgi:hypothetical protein